MESTSTPLPGSPTHNHRSPAHTPTLSNLGDWSSCNLAHTPSSIHSNGTCHTLTPSVSPIHAELHSDSVNGKSTQSRHSSSARSSQRRGRSNWVTAEEALPRPSFEPKNLLSLFDETTLEGQPWVDCQFTFRDTVFHFRWKTNKCMNVPSSLLSLYELLFSLPFCNSPTTASFKMCVKNLDLGIRIENVVRL